MPSDFLAMLNADNAGVKLRVGGYGGSEMSSSQFDRRDRRPSTLFTEVMEPAETSTSDMGFSERANMERATLAGDKVTVNLVAESIMRIDPAALELRPDPIPSEWILEGNPQARVSKVMTSRDWTSSVVVWDCSIGSFKWHYAKDETAFFISGEAFMTDDKNEEHRFGAGDIAFIAAGTSCRWRVTEPIRKIAIVRETIWRPLGFMLKISKKLFRGEHSQLKTDVRPTN
jgi:uncharacterized protein